MTDPGRGERGKAFSEIFGILSTARNICLGPQTKLTSKTERKLVNQYCRHSLPSHLVLNLFQPVQQATSVFFTVIIQSGA